MAYTAKQRKEFKSIIIEGVANGKSLSSILRKKNMPSRPIVYEWLNPDHKKHDSKFLNNYVRAQEESADLNAERIEEIAEDTLKDKYKADAAKVAIDALKWAAGVKKPKKYGKTIDVTTGGESLNYQPIWGKIDPVLDDKKNDGSR